MGMGMGGVGIQQTSCLPWGNIADWHDMVTAMTHDNRRPMTMTLPCLAHMTRGTTDNDYKVTLSVAAITVRHVSFFGTEIRIRQNNSRRMIAWLQMSSRFFSERELMFMFAICRRPSVCLSSVVYNVRAPYSGDWNFRQCFYAIWYLGHMWPFGKNFMEIVPGEPLRRRVKPKRGRKM